MIKPINNNVLVTLVNKYKEWPIEYSRENQFDYLLNSEVCCRIESIAEDATRLSWLELPLYFVAMYWELEDVWDWYYIIHQERVKWLSKDPIYKDDFSRNMHRLYGKL